jgi:hypothetical protein
MSNHNISISIDINALRDFIKENPTFVYKGKKDYISLMLYANDAPDKFGNDYSLKPSSKTLKAAGVKFPFVGSAKIFAAFSNAPKAEQAPIRNAAPKTVELDEDLSF